jgi:hypothetical protein
MGKFSIMRHGSHLSYEHVLKQRWSHSTTTLKYLTIFSCFQCNEVRTHDSYLYLNCQWREAFRHRNTGIGSSQRSMLQTSDSKTPSRHEPSWWVIIFNYKESNLFRLLIIIRRSYSEPDTDRLLVHAREPPNEFLIFLMRIFFSANM